MIDTVVKWPPCDVTLVSFHAALFTRWFATVPAAGANKVWGGGDVPPSPRTPPPPPTVTKIH